MRIRNLHTGEFVTYCCFLHCHAYCEPLWPCNFRQLTELVISAIPIRTIPVVSATLLHDLDLRPLIYRFSDETL